MGIVLALKRLRKGIKTLLFLQTFYHLTPKGKRLCAGPTGPEPPSPQLQPAQRAVPTGQPEGVPGQAGHLQAWPQLVWLSGMGRVPQTEGSPAGSIPGQGTSLSCWPGHRSPVGGTYERQQIHMSLSHQ